MNTESKPDRWHPLTFIATLVVAIYAGFVAYKLLTMVPRFVAIYESLEISIPTATQLLIDLPRSVIIGAAGVAALILGGKEFLLRSVKRRNAINGTVFVVFWLTNILANEALLLPLTSLGERLAN